jgi:carbamoyl-phosphate synthase large subunit
MGIDRKFGAAYAKAQLGAGHKLATAGGVFISVRDRDKAAVLPVARQFNEIGFRIIATSGTATFLETNGIRTGIVKKVSLGRPNVIDAIKNGKIQLVINTGSGGETVRDGFEIRRAAIKYSIPYATTVAGAMAMSRGIAHMAREELNVKTVQEYHL